MKVHFYLDEGLKLGVLIRFEDTCSLKAEYNRPFAVEFAKACTRRVYRLILLKDFRFQVNYIGYHSMFTIKNRTCHGSALLKRTLLSMR